MSVQRVAVSGVAELLAAIERHQGDVYVLFCGDKREDTGESWCSDCVKAEPVIDKVFAEVKSGVLIRCGVGDRDTWKDPNNEFRVHQQFQLKEVPTLLKLGTPRRLGADDCAKEELVRMVVEDED